MLRVLNECISFFTDQQKLNYKKLLQYTRLLLKVRGRKLPFLIEPVRSVPRARRSLDSSQARQQRRALRICSFPHPVVTAVCVPDPHSLRRKEGVLLHPEREFYVFSAPLVRTLTATSPAPRFSSRSLHAQTPDEAKAKPVAARAEARARRAPR